MTFHDYLMRGMQKLLVYGNRVYHYTFPKERNMRRELRAATRTLRTTEQELHDTRNELRVQQRSNATREGEYNRELAELAQGNREQATRIRDLEGRVKRPYEIFRRGARIERLAKRPFLIVDGDTIAYASREVQKDNSRLVGTSYLRLQANSGYLAHDGERYSSRLQVGSRLYLRTKEAKAGNCTIVHLERKGTLPRFLGVPQPEENPTSAPETQQ